LRTVEVGPSAGVSDRAVRSVVHTNHPLFPKTAMWEDIETGARHYPSSRGRLRAARQFALTDACDLEALLRDRSGAPDAICKSPSVREPTGTAFSVIFDCRRREAMVAIGRPDQAPYRRIGMEQPARV
jgi:isopenicillin-N N-acyltransferase-like protein